MMASVGSPGLILQSVKTQMRGTRSTNTSTRKTEAARPHAGQRQVRGREVGSAVQAEDDHQIWSQEPMAGVPVLFTSWVTLESRVGMHPKLLNLQFSQK